MSNDFDLINEQLEVFDNEDEEKKSLKKKDFSKLLNHNDKDEIVEKLLAGESVRSIEDWLKKKYPANPQKQLSFVYLQSFRTEHLNLKADVLRDIQKERDALVKFRVQENQTNKLKQSANYRASMENYVQNSLLDYNTMMLNLLQQANEGIQKLKELDDKKGSHLNHAAIAGYLTKIQDIMQMHYKMIKDQEKKDINNNTEDYEVLKQEVNVLKEVIKEVFLEYFPEGLPIFANKLKQRLFENNGDT